MRSEIETIHQGLRRDGAIVCYSGPFSQEINEEVCEALEAYMKKHRSDPGIQPKRFSIFVELSQNIKKYFGDKSSDPEVLNRIYDSGAIVVGRSDSGFHVSTVNLVEKEDVPALVAHLESIKRLSPDSMKKAYRDSLRQKVGQRPSPGLGFLDVAKKTLGNFDYRIEEFDGNSSFFYFNAELRDTAGVIHG